MKFWVKYKNYILLHIVLAVYSFLGISSKIASGKQFLSFGFIFWYGIVLLNLFLYAVVWQQILKKMNLITAYANKAITVVWGLFWGYILFGDEVTITKIIGIIIIIIGVVLVVKSEEEKI